MFELAIPIESHKGYLVSTFQAGAMRFPESIGVSMPIWEPLDYLRFCVSEIKSLLSSKRDRSCIPVSIRPLRHGFVADCYWVLTDLHTGLIGINQCYRFKKGHFRGIHISPEEWWKDVDIFQPWLTVERGYILEWLKVVLSIVTAENYDIGELAQEIPYNHFILTPFLKIGEKFACGLRLPQMTNVTVFGSNLNNATPLDYFRNWHKALSQILNVPHSSSIIAFDIDQDGVPTKWLVAENKCQKKILFTAPQEMFSSEVDIKEVERWVYNAGTLLQRIVTIDDDPDILPIQRRFR